MTDVTRTVNQSARLGERHAVHGIVVDWNTKGRRRPTWGRRHVDADLVDVSVSGALFLAPPNEKLVRGAVLTIAAGGALGTITIKRVAAITNQKLCVYGVAFVEIEPPLEALLFSHIAAHRPSEVKELWEHAR